MENSNQASGISEYIPIISLVCMIASMSLNALQSANHSLMKILQASNPRLGIKQPHAFVRRIKKMSAPVPSCFLQGVEQCFLLHLIKRHKIRSGFPRVAEDHSAKADNYPTNFFAAMHAL